MRKIIVIRVFLKPMLLLTLVFVAVIVLIRVQPYDDSELRAFLTPPDGCVRPCFIGIRPGVTTREEALTILESHEWVSALRPQMYSGDSGTIQWEWRAPFSFFRTGFGGALSIFDNQVSYVDVYNTTLRFGDIWLLLEHPENGRFIYVASETVSQIHYIIFSYGSLNISTQINCRNFWQSESVIEIMTSATTSPTGDYTIQQARELACKPEQIAYRN